MNRGFVFCAVIDGGVYVTATWILEPSETHVTKRSFIHKNEFTPNLRQKTLS